MDDVLKKICDALLWMLRDATGKFPYKIRITLFFTKEDGSTHYHEHERRIDVEEAEEMWFDYQKSTVAKNVVDFLKGEKDE